MKYIYIIVTGIILININVLSQYDEYYILNGIDSFQHVVTPIIEIEADRLKNFTATAPGKVNAYYSYFINSANSSKLYDVLNQTSGTFIRDYGFNTGIKTISLNSAQSEHTLIMFNGVKLNTAQNSMFDLSLFNTDDVDHIEILSGGSSALYGSEAIGGVINLVPEKPGRFSVKLKSEIGSFNFKSLSAGIKGKIKKSLDYSISGSYESSSNNFEYNYFDGFSEKILERQNTSHKKYSIYSLLSYGFKNFDIKGYVFFNYLNRELPPPVTSVSSLSSYQNDENVISDLSLSNNSNSNIHYKINFDYKYGLQHYYDPNTFNTTAPINSFYNLHSLIHSSEINFSRNESINYLAGYELSYNTMRSNETANAEQIQFGIYNTLIYAPFAWLRIYPSLRYDHYSNIKKNVISSKIGVNVLPLNKLSGINVLSIKASVGSNHRVPAFNDLYWNGLGNPELKPEHSLSFDAGLFYNFNFYSVNTLELTYTQIDTKDRIVWNPDENGVWRPSNIGRVQSRSFDISYRNRSENLSGFQWEFSFNYNIASALKKSENYIGDPTFDKQMIYIPQELAKSYLMLDQNIRSSFITNISLNTFYTFTGKRFLDAENINFSEYYELLDANMSVSINLLKVNTTLKFAVNNILNQDYEPVPGYPMPLRNYKVQFSFKY